MTRNLPELSHNVWHNMHWLIPAVAQLHADVGLQGRVPRLVVLLLLFEGYAFTETGGDLAQATVAPIEEQHRHLDAWVVRQAPLLHLLTASPPVLLGTVQRRCFGRLVWGHLEMRADRELVHPQAMGNEGLQVFRRAVERRHGADLEAFAEAFWPRETIAGEMPVRLVLVQRSVQDKRAFKNVDVLIAAALQPLEKGAEVSWRMVADLEAKPLLKQVAIFRSAEVLIGAVGAALAWLVLMRPGAQVLEWVPRGVPKYLYRCSEAWNADKLGMFGGLGRLANVDHVCLHSVKQVGVDLDHQRWAGAKATVEDAYWRTQDLEVDPEKFARWTKEAATRATRTRQPPMEVN